MTPRQVLGALGASAAIGALLCSSAAAAATQIVTPTNVEGDQIYVQWADPQFVGNLLDAATGLPYPPGTTNTFSTAVYNLGSPTPATSATITWGSCNGCSLPYGTAPFSSVTFTGGPIPDDGTKGTVPFALGDISYTNGTSLDGTQIFGAALFFYASPDGGATLIPLGSDYVAMTATVNDGDTIQNADYLNFTGTSVSFNVLEGVTATATLTGTIVGDPHVIPDTVILDPGQGANGYIGNSPPAPVPEPAAWALLIVGIGAVGVALRQRRVAATV